MILEQAPNYKILKAHFEQLTKDSKHTICDYQSQHEDITKIIW